MEAKILLNNLVNSKVGSIEEKVNIDIFMNDPRYINSINFIRAFHGPIIRDDVIHILNATILEESKQEISKSLRVTIPGYLKEIKDTLLKFKK